MVILSLTSRESIMPGSFFPRPYSVGRKMREQTRKRFARSIRSIEARRLVQAPRQPDGGGETSVAKVAQRTLDEIFSGCVKTAGK